VLVILTLRQQLSIKLADGSSNLLAEAVDDVQAQLDGLVFDGFVRQTPTEWLNELPRYLQAIEQRMVKAGKGGAEPAAVKELVQHVANMQRMSVEESKRVPLYRWMIEEWRVSIFSQELGTRVPVSSQRISRYLNGHN